MKVNLSKEKKLKLIRGLIKNPSTFYGGESECIINLLDYLFDLRTKPSQDDR